MERKKKEYKDKNIIILLGPTSTGKTSTALGLCRKFNGEIISADSRQAVKLMDIGTGKFPVGLNFDVRGGNGYWEINGVKVWAYDLVNPNEFFSGYDFADFALKKAIEILDLGKNVFVVGGTGFYIDLFTGEAKPSGVLPDFELREELEKLSLENLQKKLKKINLKEFERIDNKNRVRLIRAIEKNCSLKVNKKKLPYLKNCKFVLIGLKAPRKILYERADSWVESIWSGVTREVKNLCNLGYKDSPKLHGLVYKTILKYIDKDIGEKDSLERIKFDIHAYIRRQMTWFKRKKNVTWVDISQDDYKEIIYNIVKEKLVNG